MKVCLRFGKKTFCAMHQFFPFFRNSANEMLNSFIFFLKHFMACFLFFFFFLSFAALHQIFLFLKLGKLVYVWDQSQILNHPPPHVKMCNLFFFLGQGSRLSTSRQHRHDFAGQDALILLATSNIMASARKT